jgi:uncharacterized membrane protein
VAEVITQTGLPPGREILRIAGPRIARDILGPLAAFYLGYKLIGFGAGIAFASVVGLCVAGLARREGRPGLIAAIAVTFICARAIAGGVSGSTTAYLAGDVVLEVILAAVFLGSLVLGRPVAAEFASEVYPVPDDAREHEGYMGVFTLLTAVWGVFFLCLATLRLIVLLTGSVDRYVLVAACFALAQLGLLAWSARYSIRAYREAFELEAETEPEPEPA